MAVLSCESGLHTALPPRVGVSIKLGLSWKNGKVKKEKIRRIEL